MKLDFNFFYTEKTRLDSTSSSIIAKLEDEVDDEGDVKVTSDISDFSDDEDDENRERKERLSPVQSPASTNQNDSSAAAADVRLQNVSVGQSESRDSNNSSQSNMRPKIWSIDEIMNKDRTNGAHCRVVPRINPLLQSLSVFHSQLRNANVTSQELKNQEQLKRYSDSLEQSPFRKSNSETALNLAISDKNGLNAARTRPPAKPSATGRLSVSIKLCLAMAISMFANVSLTVILRSNCV